MGNDMSRPTVKLNGLDVRYLPGFAETAPSEAEFARLESELGHPLASDYKKFLVTYGGTAFWSSVHFPVIEAELWEDNGIVNLFFGILPGDAYDIWRNYSEDPGRVPSDLLPIAQSALDGYICLGLWGDRLGRVYVWDRNLEQMAVPGHAPSYSNVFLVALDLDSFLKSLYVVRL
jgi:hypothetical protein